MGYITSICSGKDGVGKSTVAALLGEAMAFSGSRVLLIEFENGLRCLDRFLAANESTLFNIGDVMSGKCSSGDAVAVSPLSPNLSVIFAGFAREECRKKQFPELIAALSARYDHILLDTDCSDESLKAVSAIAMNNLIISTQDPTGVRDAEYVCEKLFSYGAPNLKVVFNRVNSAYIRKGFSADLDTCMDVVGAPLAGVITEIPEIYDSVMNGRPLQKGSLPYTIFDNIRIRLEGGSAPLAVI